MLKRIRKYGNGERDEEKEILELAAASVTGGLAGGLLFDDKKYRKSMFLSVC